MSPAEFVARDALVFWVGTLAVLAPVALAAWLWRRRIVAACDRFWDRFDPPEPDPFASARQFAESQVGRPYQYGVASVPDNWYSDATNPEAVEGLRLLDAYETVHRDAVSHLGGSTERQRNDLIYWCFLHLRPILAAADGEQVEP